MGAAGKGFTSNIGASPRSVKDEKPPADDSLRPVPEAGHLAFVVNDLRDYEPALAARIESEITEAVRASDDAGGILECHVIERDHRGRTRIAVTITGRDWKAGFTVSQPPAAGEVRMETRKALRDRGRRVPHYRRPKRR